MIIENLGVGVRCKETMRLFLTAETNGILPDSFKRIILLPIPTSRDKIHLSGTDKLISEIFEDVGSADFVAAYGLDEPTKSELKNRGATVYDALDDEQFLAENARETALGAIGYILSTQITVPADTHYSIVGYGRIGRELARILLFFGAPVRVFSTTRETCLELGECGVKAHLIDRDNPIITTDADIIINTAPTDLSASFPEGRLPDGVRVIELASGNNFADIAGIERLPGIPDKYYGKSAGRAYYNRIINYMSEVKKK